MILTDKQLTSIDSTINTPCPPKNCAKLFLSELCQIPSTVKIFGTNMEKRINLCEVQSYSNDLISTQYTEIRFI